MLHLSEIALKVGLGLATAAGTAWLGLSAYSQPRERADSQRIVTEFLENALDGDSAALAARAGADQPVARALELVRDDSFAVRAWTSHGGAVLLTRRDDTLWIAFARDPDSPVCGNYSSLVATALDPVRRGERARIVRLTATCLEPAVNPSTP
jgi:hypothetical protein